MVNQLIPANVPYFWEAIKFACVEADEVDKTILPQYCNELLTALLSDNAQCFVRLDEKRILVGILITRLQFDKITGDKYLYLQCLYSWQKKRNNEWEADAEFIRKFADGEGCKYITYNSRNENIWSLSESIGFREKYRTYDLFLGGRYGQQQR